MSQDHPFLAVGIATSGDAVAKRLQELYRLFPKEVTSAQLRVASIARRKIAASVKNQGNADTGPLKAHSELRSRLWPRMPFGGIYNTEAQKLCRVGRLIYGGGNYSVTAGYVNSVGDAFIKWQKGGEWLMTTRTRQRIHRMLVYGGNRGTEVPRMASQPERQVVDPIFQAMRPKLPEWVLSAALKLIDKKLTRAGV
jgi:hypothetical protein